MDRRVGSTAGEDSAAVALAVGVAVGVEEKIEPRRRAQVEQGEGLTGVVRSDQVDRREKGGTATHLVGLRAPCGEELEKLGPMRQAEVLEIGDQVIEGRVGRSWIAARCILRAGPSPGPPGWPGSSALAVDDRLHGVVVRGEGMTRTSEQEEMHGGQQEVRPALAEGRLTDETQNLGIVGDAAADDVVRRGAVLGCPLGEDPELFRERQGGQRPTGGPGGYRGQSRSDATGGTGGPGGPPRCGELSGLEPDTPGWEPKYPRAPDYPRKPCHHPGMESGRQATVTSVPRGVRGKTIPALAIGISTQPTLWGNP